MVKVGILGAAAYTSLELIKILLRHSGVEVSYLAARRDGNPEIAEIFPVLADRLDVRCSHLDNDAIPDDIGFVFVTLPPTVAMKYTPAIVARGVKVVDLSADYRFRDGEIYERYYKAKHSDPDGIRDAVYGLPELFRDEVRAAALVANPGCYPTGAILGLAPLLMNGMVSGADIIVDSKSGVSGAGREPTETTHYCERNENIEAYKIGNHRHTPEICHILQRITGSAASVIFTPHLIPMNRGMLNTIYARVERGVSVDAVTDVFCGLYGDEPFVRLRRGGVSRVVDVVNTNCCDIAFEVVDGRIIVVSCIDNLVKGASGQAVQNMNLMLGFDETEALL